MKKKQYFVRLVENDKYRNGALVLGSNIKGQSIDTFNALCFIFGGEKMTIKPSDINQSKKLIVWSNSEKTVFVEIELKA